MKNQGGDTKAAPRPAAKTSGALGEEGDPSEPTAALDEVTAREFLGNLKAACRQRGTTVVCVCHSRSLVDEFADEEIRLEARA